MAKKSLAIEWTLTAERQFFDILDYWISRNKSTEYAEKLSRLVWKKTEFIAKNIYASKATQFTNTRIASLGHFSIVYKFSAEKIIIVAF